MERYWLCDECAVVWTLMLDGEHGIRLAALPQPVASVPRVPAKWTVA